MQASGERLWHVNQMARHAETNCGCGVGSEFNPSALCDWVRMIQLTEPTAGRLPSPSSPLHQTSANEFDHCLDRHDTFLEIVDGVDDVNHNLQLTFFGVALSRMLDFVFPAKCEHIGACVWNS